MWVPSCKAMFIVHAWIIFLTHQALLVYCLIALLSIARNDSGFFYFFHFFSSICTAIRSWLFSAASERVVARLRKDLFSHLIQQVRVINDYCFINFAPAICDYMLDHWVNWPVGFKTMNLQDKLQNGITSLPLFKNLKQKPTFFLEIMATIC